MERGKKSRFCFGRKIRKSWEFVFFTEKTEHYFREHFLCLFFYRIFREIAARHNQHLRPGSWNILYVRGYRNISLTYKAYCDDLGLNFQHSFVNPSTQYIPHGVEGSANANDRQPVSTNEKHIYVTGTCKYTLRVDIKQFSELFLPFIMSSLPENKKTFLVPTQTRQLCSSLKSILVMVFFFLLDHISISLALVNEEDDAGKHFLRAHGSQQLGYSQQMTKAGKRQRKRP